jgi:hypothetical protein
MAVASLPKPQDFDNDIDFLLDNGGGMNVTPLTFTF